MPKCLESVRGQRRIRRAWRSREVGNTCIWHPELNTKTHCNYKLKGCRSGSPHSCKCLSSWLRPGSWQWTIKTGKIFFLTNIFWKLSDVLRYKSLSCESRRHYMCKLMSAKGFNNTDIRGNHSFTVHEVDLQVHYHSAAKWRPFLWAGLKTRRTFPLRGFAWSLWASRHH